MSASSSWEIQILALVKIKSMEDFDVKILPKYFEMTP